MYHILIKFCYDCIRIVDFFKKAPPPRPQDSIITLRNSKAATLGYHAQPSRPSLKCKQTSRDPSEKKYIFVRVSIGVPMSVNGKFFHQ